MSTGKGPVILCFHEVYRRPYIMGWAARFAHENGVSLHVVTFGDDIGEPSGRGEVTAGVLSLAEICHRYPDMTVTSDRIGQPLRQELVDLAREQDAYAMVLPPIVLQDTADVTILDHLARSTTCPLIVMPELWVPRPGQPVVACVDGDQDDVVLPWSFDYAFERGIDVVAQVIESEQPSVPPVTKERGGFWPWRRRPRHQGEESSLVDAEALLQETERPPGVDLTTRRCACTLTDVLAWPKDEAALVVATFDVFDALPRPEGDAPGLTPFLVRAPHPVVLIPRAAAAGESM